MAKKVPVLSLSECALTELVNNIVAAFGFAMQTDLGNDITMTIIEINSYLEESGATSNIYQDLLKIILGSDYLEASIRYTCLRSLLNESVQQLNTEIFPFAYYDRILQVIATQGTGLRSLNLKGVWIKDEHMSTMYDIIKKLPNLTKLSIPYIADDDLLSVIAENSKKLKVLDISGETDITEIGLECLSMGVARESLTIVNIGMLGEENICHTDVALLILCLPNLTNLQTYSYVGKSLLYIYEEKNQNFKCKLKYLHDTATTESCLDAIVSTCPELESIYLDSPNSGILNKLSALKLRQIKIYRFSCSEFIDVLEDIGDRLVHLTLIKGKGSIDLGRIAFTCSNIIDLDCYMMEQLLYTFERKFNGIEGLEILNSPMAATSLKHFLCRSTSLKRLAVDTVHFTDDDMVGIFLENRFNWLEDIWFTSAKNLTLNTVEVNMMKIKQYFFS